MKKMNKKQLADRRRAFMATYLAIGMIAKANEAKETNEVNKTKEVVTR